MATGSALSASSPLLIKAGDQAIIPGWRMQSTANVTKNLASLSRTGVDVSSWLPVAARGSVFAGLLENDVYNDTELFYSTNLDTMVDWSKFIVPWLYREEFTINTESGQHYFLQTNGVTSRADIYINGKEVASTKTQVGAYGGKKYDVTEFLSRGNNALLIVAYPTNYLRDFAMGFVDWNPYPADNGTGVWRYVEMVQSGQVSMSPPRIKTDFDYTWKQTVTLVVRIDITNNGKNSVNAQVTANINPPDESGQIELSQTFSLQAGQQKTVTLATDISDPQIWWPTQWGKQPLYNVSSSISVNGKTSDIAPSRAFGIRHVSSYVNSHNDTQFIVNGHPFLVMGAGYSSDIFYRFDVDHQRTKFQRILDMGLNTIRLEGKQEHPEMYDLADEMGLMIMPGWECCDKWEGWTYNDEADGVKWDNADYTIAQAQMLHEAQMMQTHPCILAFLVGSDYWPDDRATQVYVDALNRMDWPNPVIASAAKLSYPQLLGPSGMKMDGPYDWVPPNYWYNDQLGAAFGFGSELGAGVGTPEMSSLRKFLSNKDLDDLWQHPNKTLYHMSTNVSSFPDRSIYNGALYNRYGAPRSLDDYVLKAQLSDYEATRSQYEAYTAWKSNARPATGLIYWMLQGAWPNLHWQLFDYYLQPMGSYYGVKTATRSEHVVYDYNQSTVWVTNNNYNSSGTRKVSLDLFDLNGKILGKKSTSLDAAPLSSQNIGEVPGVDNIDSVALLKLLLEDGKSVLSRNVYWLPAHNDVMNWTNSSWFATPVTKYADMTKLFDMEKASVTANVEAGSGSATVQLQNKADVPAVFIRLRLVSGKGSSAMDVETAWWDDNYVTLWPGEQLDVGVKWTGKIDDVGVIWDGVNVPQGEVSL